MMEKEEKNLPQNWQGKTKEKLSFSATVCAGAIAGVVIVLVITAIWSYICRL